MKRNILVTGGAGFIGSHLVRLLANKYPTYHIINMDLLTYAGNLENLKDIEYKENYSFVKCDICDFKKVKQVFVDYKIDSIIHLAAESHVDRSIEDPFSFAQTNVMGTLSLLQAAKSYWESNFENKLFYHVSTDEVYGSLGQEGFFTEETNYDPHSPYSASKASSDHFVRAFYHTYKLPVIISNCSNNFGPNQNNEKLTASYSAYIMERIEANWNRPPSARRGMEVALIIQLVPTGQVISVTMVKSSGSEAFDRSAQQAVHKVGRFERLQQLDAQAFEKNFRKLRLVFRPDDLRL